MSLPATKYHLSIQISYFFRNHFIVGVAFKIHHTSGGARVEARKSARLFIKNRSVYHQLKFYIPLSSTTVFMDYEQERCKSTTALIHRRRLDTVYCNMLRVFWRLWVEQLLFHVMVNINKLVIVLHFC